jgi:hypothetical protein
LRASKTPQDYPEEDPLFPSTLAWVDVLAEVSAAANAGCAPWLRRSALGLGQRIDQQRPHSFVEGFNAL